MSYFETIYNQLNDAQRKAVDTIDGPLLVIAGPGTGKTQLLSARVANILRKTDTLPQNILCLTFTESGARAMRERLTGMIGTDAYDVHISTYHAFGTEIITQYPEYFETIKTDRDEDIRFEQPIDELSQLQIIMQLIDKLPFDNPMSNARYHPKDAVQTIGELKKQLISPENLRILASDNIQQVNNASSVIQETYGHNSRIPSFKKAVPLFSDMLDQLRSMEGELIDKACTELELALEEANSTESTKPLTAWKNDWLHKNESELWQFTDAHTHQKMLALAGVYADYESTLRSTGKYDFNDMIVAVVQALEEKPELRANLQERYQYLLLDEFQDTNAAQFKLVSLIADHPVHEGRPNIMAVGDDDQAIFAFQGADVSNMLKFDNSYRDVTIVNLTQNYRSHRDILHTAHNVAEQIETRLHQHLDNVNKTLESASQNLPEQAIIQRHEFTARASEYDWVAKSIAEQIQAGIPPEEITVLAPKHALLEALVPFLQKYNVPVAYEKRENILDTPIIQGLILQSQLLEALTDQDDKRASSLFPVVLSLDHWGVSTDVIWRINWAHSKDSYDQKRSWAELALNEPEVADWVRFFLHISSTVRITPLEYILDMLMGITSVTISSDTELTSPLKSFYFSSDKKQKNAVAYYESISHLSVLRAKLREQQQNSDNLLSIHDLLELHAMYRAADQPIINSHPVAQSTSAVQLMTAYKAKGLEFTAVYLLSLHDDVWGKKSRGGSNKITLPPNLTYIRYRGSDEDEMRRILFVAITRAKHQLYLTSHAQKDSGKITEPVKYLAETTIDDRRRSATLPEKHGEVTEHSHTTADLQEQTATLWQQRHVILDASLKSLLQERLSRYQMSPTHLNTFIDTKYGGPEAFLLGTLLRFPQAPGESGEYGNAIHATLEALQKHVKKTGSSDSFDYENIYRKEIQKRYIADDRRDHYIDKGIKSLSKYITARQKMLAQPAETEVDFRREGVLIGDAHLSGKIDRLEVDKKNKELHIVDFKTGKVHTKWSSDLSLHKYKQQLYFYKFLIEGSHTYEGYRVATARLQYVEPNSAGDIVEPLHLVFNESEELHIKNLVEAVWRIILLVELPNITEYKDTIAGTRQFEKDVIAKYI